jgi:hypothetical protein
MKRKKLKDQFFFGLLGYQVYLGTKKLKITNFFLPINGCLKHTKRGGGGENFRREILEKPKK